MALSLKLFGNSYIPCLLLITMFLYNFNETKICLSIKMLENIMNIVLDPPEKPDDQTIHYFSANFGQLLRTSVTNPMLITIFDTYLTLRSPEVWV